MQLPVKQLQLIRGGRGGRSGTDTTNRLVPWSDDRDNGLKKVLI